MTRGKAEAKYFPRLEENLRLSEIERKRNVWGGKGEENGAAGQQVE